MRVKIKRTIFKEVGRKLSTTLKVFTKSCLSFKASKKNSLKVLLSSNMIASNS